MAEQTETTVVEETQTTAESESVQQAEADRKVFDDLIRRSAADTEDKTEDSADSGEPEEVEGSEDAEEEVDSTEGDTKGKPAVEASAEAEDAEPELDPDFDTALNAAVRDGIPEERIEQWYKDDPKGFVAHGIKRQKAQLDQDRFGSEYLQKREAFEAWEKSQSESPDTAAEASAKESPKSEDLEKQIAEVLAPLADEDNEGLYDDLSETLKKGFLTMANQIGGQFKEQVAAQAEEIQNLRFARIEDKLSMARERMTETYPRLSDDGVLEDVLTKYDVIVKNPESKVSSIEQAFEEACKWTFATTDYDDLKTRLIARNTKRKAGQPRASAPAEVDKTLTPDQEDLATFQRLRQQHFGKDAG
jgi:hypothetical protein